MTEFSWGPHIRDDGTLFRLWAPSCENVSLEVAGRSPLAMNAAKEGWREIICDAPPGTRYRFLIGDRPVPDPASRAQAGDCGGMSVVPDADYPWRCTDWRGRPWEETVLYELHPGVMGGFRVLAARLPDLAELGVTAIELMPVADFSGARNWGYDGVLPFAPDETYGTPDDLRFLVDAAHTHGLMVFLDVVYNHFGPEGNFLPLYAPGFFHPDRHTPWGSAIAYDRPEVRRFFIENALYWLQEFRIDGLRLDAVHAIRDRGFLRALARDIRAAIPAGRFVHLVVENEDNDADLLERDFDAQWNDDLHHALHVLLTGETAGYYADFADRPAEKLARALKEGFVYQGQYSGNCGGPRGHPSAHLPPTAFVAFLQNHDHVGNRAFGERLTVFADPAALRAATALLLLMPQIPLLFMGEECGAREPFLYFCDHADPALADAVREGRRAEFKKFPEFDDPEKRAHIPDPNALSSFERSRPRFDGPDAAEKHILIRDLLALRHRHIIPRLKGARAEGAEALGEKAVIAHWRMGGGGLLTIACNLGGEAVAAPLPGEAPLWGAAAERLSPYTTLCWLSP
jgi:maltooligosyltrehalose trehalohydrolase